MKELEAKVSKTLEAAPRNIEGETIRQVRQFGPLRAP
jgi:hypothetical protein